MELKQFNSFASLNPKKFLIALIGIPLVVVALKIANIASTVTTNLMIGCLFVVSLLILNQAGKVMRWRSVSAPREPESLHQYECPAAPDDMRPCLIREGYVFHADGEYAERGSLRRGAHAVLLCSLALLLLVGCFDNLRAMSGMIFVNTGDPRPLNTIKEYSFYSKGPLAQLSEIAYKIKGVRLMLPDATYPNGAMDVRILTLDESSSWQYRMLAGGTAHQKDGFDFSLIALEYDVVLTILVDGNHLVFTDAVHFIPASVPSDGFSHEGKLTLNERDDLDGTARFDPNTDRVRVQVRHKKHRFKTELGNAPEHEQTVGAYVVRNEGIARWGQVRVIRRRHLNTLIVLAGFVILAGVVTMMIPRRCLWLRATESGGSQFRGDDAELMERIMEKLKMEFR